MTRVLIRVDADISDELAGALRAVQQSQRTTTTLTGDLVDQQELQGVLNLLRQSSLGVDVIEVVTIPD